MKTNSQIRQETTTLMRGNWSTMAVIAVVFGVFYLFTANSFPLVLFVYFPLSLGLAMTMLHFVRGAKSVGVGNLFSAFNAKYYWKSMGLGVLIWVYTFLWSLLFVIPGIIKIYSYFLAPYILADNPNITAEEAICRSMRMMDGRKMQLFLMTLGYALLVMLSTFLFCIPLLWVVPYYNAVFAKFYEEVKNSY